MDCKRCGYIWEARVQVPKQCPKCKQTYYNRPRSWEEVKKEPQVTNEYQELPKILPTDSNKPNEYDDIEKVVEKDLQEIKKEVKKIVRWD